MLDTLHTIFIQLRLFFPVLLFVVPSVTRSSWGEVPWVFAFCFGLEFRAMLACSRCLYYYIYPTAEILD